MGAKKKLLRRVKSATVAGGAVICLLNVNSTVVALIVRASMMAGENERSSTFPLTFGGGSAMGGAGLPAWSSTPLGPLVKLSRGIPEWSVINERPI